MTKMSIPPADRPRVMLECVRMIATLRLDPARQTLIRDFMNAYLRLSADERRAYNEAVRQIDPPDREAVMQIVDQFEEWGVAKGLAMGQATAVLRVLRRRFGMVPPDLEARINDLPVPSLEALADALLDFADLAQVEEWVRQRA